MSTTLNTKQSINFNSRPSHIRISTPAKGRRYDLLTGTYDFRNGVYSPTMMRWMQQDPMGYVDGMNDYQAMADNPINSTDPMGLWKFVPQMGVLTGQLSLWAGSASKSDFQLTFTPDKAKFKGAACDEINFIQIYYYNHKNTSLEGISGLIENDLIHDKWTIDGTTPPYYEPKFAVDPAKGPLGMHDSPGNANSPWQVTDASWDFETVVVATKGKDKGDVYADIKWGFKYRVTGYSWNHVIHPTYYVNDVRWSPGGAPTILPIIDNATGKTVKDKDGKDKTQILGGAGANTYAFYESQRHETISKQMKAVLDEYFPTLPF